MRHVIIRGFLSRKLRSSLTALAIILGVSMIVGSSVLTGQIKGAFDGIFLESRKSTDVVITKNTEFQDNQGQTTVPFSQDLLAKVTAVAGVQKAVGSVTAISAIPILMVNGKPTPLKTAGGAPALGFSLKGAPFDTGTITAGRAPSATGEVALEERTADQQHVKVGTHLVLATSNGVHDVTVVGIFHFAAAVGGATTTIVTLADGQSWFDRVGKFDEIDVQAASGVSASQLRDRIRAALPALTVRTGIEQAKQESADVGSFVDVLGYALLAIGFASAFAGAFIIFITFWITVGQRIRELALLRTLGASRRQILSSVLAEAVIVGVLASGLGIVAGLGIAKAIAALFDAIGFGLPIGAMHLSAGTVVVSFLIGTGVTLAASFAPALRSTRIPPVAAIRDGATLPPGWLSRHSKPLSLIVFALGVTLVVYGIFGADGTAAVLSSIGFGALISLVGVALTAPLVIPHLARAIGAPGVWWGGIPGRIARENAERNPSRTAVTSAALMIGIFMVTFVAVFAAGLQKSISDVLGTDIKAQFFVSSGGVFDNGAAGLSPTIADDLRSVPGVASVSPTTFLSSQISGTKTDLVVSTAAPTFADAYHLRWVTGTDDLIRTLGAKDAVIDADTAKADHLKVGSVVSIHNRAGVTASFTVRGIVKASAIVQGLLISPEAGAPLEERTGVAFMFVVLKPGVDEAVARAALEATATKANPLVQVQSNQDVIDQASTQINQVVIPLYALVAVIFLIAIVGIVNTLLLSVFERTREIGLLRAVGTTRRQVRRMVRYESVITSLIGAALGVLVGVGFGALIITRLDSIPFTIPVTQLIVVFLIAFIAGILAAILPARRASRLNVLEALQYE
jgi:putative ABC transport system permease protein